jgi:hypothetical protein
LAVPGCTQEEEVMPVVYAMYAILVAACAAILFPSEVVELIAWVLD